jgi:serine/threonine protein kinase
MKPRLINEGTYGCIFNPGFTCNYNSSIGAKRKESLDIKFATKVHSNVNTSIVRNEILISAKIRDHIPNFDTFFSPVLETCKVNLAKVDADKCKIVKDKKATQFISTKMKYVEGLTLNKHVDQMLNRVKVQTKRYAEVVTLYKKICLGLAELRSINVVHFDLKDNNIIVTKSGSPIIIDFGISIDMDKIMETMDKTLPMNSVAALAHATSSLPATSSAAAAAVAALAPATSSVHVTSSPKSESSKQDLYKFLDTSFYTFSTEYRPWCIDIVLISFIVQKQKPKDPITSSQIMNIFDEVMQKSKISTKPYLKDAFSIYRERFRETVADKYNDMENVLLLHHLLRNFNRWDLYSATVLFMDMLEKIHQAPNAAHLEEIKRGLGFIA